MAKQSAKNRNNIREKLVVRGSNTRQALKKLIRKSQDEDERMQASVDLAKRKRDESPSRVRNRCEQCGRPHGVYRRFKLCRICLRIAAMRGDVPGLRKASW